MFHGVSDEDKELLLSLPLNKPLKFKVTQHRNYKFLQKMHVFFNMIYEHACEYDIYQVEYKNQIIVPNKELFRKEITILAGFFTWQWGIDYKTLEYVRKPVADSISYENCSEQKANKIFSACINVAIKQVYKNQIDEEELNNRIGEILSFA